MTVWHLIIVVLVLGQEMDSYVLEADFKTEEECVESGMGKVREIREDPNHPPIINITGDCVELPGEPI